MNSNDMKKILMGMAAAAVILIGMGSCGGKKDAHTAEAAQTAQEQVEYTTTPSGLKYRVIKEGTGRTPEATDMVTVHYQGKLTNGKVFDSSYMRGEPATFGLNQVIPGWTEGLQLMKEGAVYEFYIPSNLAYGERGAGADIPPNSDLIFVVELLQVQ